MIRLLALALLLAAAAAPARAENAGDLVQVWLAQHGLIAAPGDFSTCQPEGGVDAVCSWNTGKLGAQPSDAQLAALAPAVQNIRQAQQVSGIIKSGLAITSTGTPALNGTYGVDQAQQMNITAETVSLMLNGTFTNGQATKAWPDMSGAVHTFDVAHFKAFATAIAAYVDDVLVAARTLATGTSASWPSASKTID